MKKMSTIKKIILSVVSVVVLAVVVYFAYTIIHYTMFRDYKKYVEKNAEYEAGTEFAALNDSDKKVSGMVLAAENDSLKLYINTDNAEVAVYDKRTGTTTYSNPPEGGKDPNASTTNKAYLQSQLIVDFFNENRNSTTYNSYDYSTSVGQFEIESITNGVRVIYTIGDLSSASGIAPMYITSERLESFLANLSDKNAKYVRRNYLEDSDIPGFLQLNAAVIEAPATLRKVINYLTEAGYTQEDYDADMAAAGANQGERIHFIIPLEYTLEADGLKVRIPVEHVEEHGEAMIYRIQVLRYFGASYMADEDKGYMLVPNGSGSLIYFNNGKVDTNEYSQYVYGIDPVSADYLVRENTEQVRMPIFGMYYANSDSGILAVIENSDSHALISANVSGKVNSYNYVYPTFMTRGYDKLSMFGTTGNEADIPIVEANFYDTDIVVRYSFLTSEHSGYSGMANYYRDKLVADGTLTKLEQKSEIPFYMDLIGGVKRTANLLGVQYLDVFAMTTYEQAEEIIEDLNAGGVNRIVTNYQGWFNEGYYHDVADKIKLVKELGSRKELEALADKLEAAGGKLYGDVAFQKVTYISDRFDYTRESARYYGAGYIVSFGQTSPVTLTQTASLGYRETLYDVISPKFLVRYTQKFADKIDKYDITGISLRDLGDYLSSDKKRKEVILREEAKQIVEAQFDLLAETGKNIMVSGGNLYAIDHADDIINMPTSGNSYLIVDETIPFYQMLVHGYIDYTGTAINLDDSFNKVDSVLTMIEYGAAPHFVFTSEASSEMKYTGLNGFYSTTYKNQGDTTEVDETVFSWDELAKSVYAEVNAVLSNVTGAAIVNHEILESGVVKVSYDNGVVIYINNQESEAVADGKTMAAKSYEVEGAGK